MWKTLQPSIVCVAMIGLTSAFLFLAIQFHESGVPQSPSPAELKLNSEISKIHADLLCSCAEAFEEFNANPDNESELGEKLILTHKRWYQYCLEAQQIPAAHLRLSEVDSQRQLESLSRFLKSTEEFCAEVKRRAEDPNFTYDKSLYVRAEKQFAKDFPANPYCSPSNCLLCRWREILQMQGDYHRCKQSTKRSVIKAGLRQGHLRNQGRTNCTKKPPGENQGVALPTKVGSDF